MTLHLFLLIGQSNMAGRGALEAQDVAPHPRVLVLNKDNQWASQGEPLHFDKPQIAGVGPGFVFAKRVAEQNPSVTIGLIPCAVGGTPLERWEPHGDLYEQALVRAKIAQKDGVLKGILWHQGEGDSGNAAAADSYGERLARMIHSLRAALAEPEVPFVAGKLGAFLLTRDPNPSPFAHVVNAALEALPEHVPWTGCADSAGLDHNGDQLHFNAAAQREFGNRYAVVYQTLINARTI